MSAEAQLAMYFVYGLAFFSLGTVLMLESWRLPRDAPQVGLVRPLAAFGLLHGTHEWMEIVLLQGSRTGQTVPAELVWTRLGLLALSFAALGFYSLQAFRYAREHLSPLSLFGILTLPAFALLAALDVTHALAVGTLEPFGWADALTRYVLGVPTPAIAALGLRAAALKARVAGRRPLDRYLNIAALGFALYSLTQLFVPKMATTLGAAINADLFLAASGFPIQLVRTLVAIIITVGLVNGTRFLEGERAALVGEAQQAHLAAVEHSRSLQRELLHRTVRAQEDERAHLARELHDELAQILTALSLDLGTLERLLPARTNARPTVQHLHQLARELGDRLQRLVQALRPTALDSLGLVPALQALVEDSANHLGLQVELLVEGSVQRLEAQVETVFYRVAQEALTNVARHAGTQRAKVRLTFAAERISLAIEDQGRGLDPSSEPEGRTGWGLVGMRERAESVGGQFRIATAPGSGTTVRVDLPAPGNLEKSR
jgi:signal transduction histidine kinase